MIRVRGTFGGWGGGTQSKVDFIWYSRDGPSVCGQMYGYVSAPTLAGYCDFLIYRKSNLTFSLYFKTVTTYVWYDFTVSGNFSYMSAVLYPETSLTGTAPSGGTTSIASVFTSAIMRLQDTAVQLSYTGTVYGSTRLSSGDTGAFTSGGDSYLASFLDSRTGSGSGGNYALYQIGRANSSQGSWFCGAYCTGTSTSTVYVMTPYNVGILSSLRFYGNGHAYKGDNTSVWQTTSDERVKENIELADLGICYDNVKNIPLKRFSYKDGFLDSDSNTDKMRLGWIAQDVQKAFPKAIGTENKGEFGNCLTINVDQMNATLFGAVKKLIEKVEILEAKVKELSG
jgi:hypothetical protein